MRSLQKRRWFIVLILLPLLSTAAYADSCEIVNASKTLTSNISTNGTCFIITVSNIILDGNGYTITGDGSGVGINNSGVDNITIKNFAGINNFSFGIYGFFFENSIIMNNVIQEGIFLWHGYGTNITSNNITATAASRSGLEIVAASDTTSPYFITSNIFSVSGSGAIGINLDGIDPSYVSNNTVNVSGQDGIGILVNLSPGAINLTSNTISVTGDGGIGISILGEDDDSVSHTIKSNIVTTSGTNGHALVLNSSPRSVFSSNEFLAAGNGSHAIVFLNASNNSFVSSLINSSVGVEVYADSDSVNNTLTGVSLLGRVNFTSHSFYGVSIDVNTTAKPADPSGKQNLSDYLTITNLSAGAFIDFNLSYVDGDVTGVTENTVSMYLYNESSGTWQVLPNPTVDTTGNTIRSGNITADFGLFAPLGNFSITYSDALNVTPATFNASAQLNLSINWTTSVTITGVSIEVNRSGTSIVYQATNVSDHTLWNLSLTDFPAGTHYWRSNASDSVSHALTTPWYAFTILRIAPTLNLTLNSTEGNVSIEMKSLIWLNGSLIAGDSNMTLELYNNGTLINNATAPANLTNFTLPGTYNITLLYRQSQNYSRNTTTYWVVVNRAVPTLNLTLNGTAANITLNENERIWINGSVITGDPVNISLYIDGSLINSSTAPANLTNFTTSGLYNLTLTYNQSENYSTSSVTYWVTVNNSLPPVVLSHSPTGTVNTSSITLNMTTNENATCRYSTTVNTTYENMTTSFVGNTTNHTLSLSSLTDGTKHYYVRCNNSLGLVSTSDYDANFSVSIPIVVTTPSGGGGGGGGGGVVDTSPTVTKVISRVTPKFGIEMTITRQTIPMTSIKIKVKESATDVRITVTAKEEKPESIPQEPKTRAGTARKVYKYIEINHTNLEGKIEEATLQFKVPNAWIANNSYNNTHIILQRYTGFTWKELPTEILRETEVNTYYNATTKRFSIFAISVKELGEESVEPEPEELQLNESVVVEPEVPPTGAIVRPEVKRKSLWWFVVPILILIAVALALVGRLQQGAPRRVPAALRLYIAKCRARKLTEREIKNLLISSGWDVELIEQGMLREEDSR